ncbi:hypothetical protein TREMEDRAFT_72376 [Tremella mesenterica DSM 1558]|nr:uncharacterized protein TREMEDRAFT_72376 [Tremella mesenterica DSM 1558]EIW66556.1 hypothetical protein TREMEDRAFT_72376 [Tremella mesenterica DSM 1558]
MESIVTGKFGSTKDAWEMGRLINNAVTVAWLRDLVFQICLTHGLIDPASPEPALRPTLVLNNLRLAILSPRCKTYIQQVASSDFSSDTFGKLYDITMTAIRTAEVLKAQRLGQGSGLLHENIPSTASSSGGGHRSSDGLSQPRGPGDHDIIWDFADVILKSMGILCMAARDHPALVRLVHAVARII